MSVGNVSNPPVLKSCYEDMTLARTASPYLFPCTIIYSIIAAGIVYRMYTYVGVKVKQRWPSHTSLTSSVPHVSNGHRLSYSNLCQHRVREKAQPETNHGVCVCVWFTIQSVAFTHRFYHLYSSQGVVSMDCEKANKGLFTGLLVAVITLIAIATFFVFDSRLNYPYTAIKVSHTISLPSLI